MLDENRPYLLADIIKDNVRWVPDEPALIFDGQVYSWSDFEQKVDKLKRGLSLIGVSRGTRVAVLDRSTDRYVFLHYALASLGAILCPINMWLRAGEISYILDRLKPTFLVTSDEFRALASDASAELQNPPLFITAGTPREEDISWETIADATDHADNIDMSSPESWNDPHMILFTSGTTGRPKGAVISHKRSVLDGMAASTAFGIRRGDRMFNYMPLFHTGAWDYLKLVFMNQGCAVVVDRFDGDEAVALIERHRCNIMFGVPLVLRKMLESPNWRSADMSSMRVLAFGNYDPGNFLDDVLEEFRRRGANQLQALFPYGLTEGGPFVTIARPDDTRKHPNTIGTPLPGVSVALLDDDCVEAPKGEIGEICVRSPALMSGYLDMPEATAEVFKGGWMHTGDLGYINEEGFLCMVDRKKDMVKSGGENVYAVEVERLLITHSDIAEVAVIGLPDPDYGEAVVAVVVPRADSNPQQEEIISFTREHIAGFKAPRRVIFANELPRTVTGKVAKADLRKTYSSTSAER